MENTKTETYLRQTLNAVLLAGIIIFLIGAYYCVVKAGVPYQDPPPELQIQYAVDMGIGEILIRNGFLISLCGGIARLLFAAAVRTRRKR